MKIAVYSYLSGKVNCFPKISKSVSNIDCFMFTDTFFTNSEWKQIVLPSDFSKYIHHDINRVIKWSSVELFNDYDITIYCDGNIEILDVDELLKQHSNNSTGISTHKHYQRTCAIDECQMLMNMIKGNYQNIQSYKKELSKTFIKDFGLAENGLIIFNKSDLVKKIQNETLSLYLKHKTYRDQIFFPKVIFDNGLEMTDVFNFTTSIYDNPFIKFNHTTFDRQDEKYQKNHECDKDHIIKSLLKWI